MDSFKSLQQQFGLLGLAKASRPGSRLTTTPAPPADTEVVWFKGGILPRFSTSYNSGARRMNHLGILGAPLTDLSWNESCLYYTDTKGCVEQYAEGTARRCEAKKAILSLLTKLARHNT